MTSLIERLRSETVNTGPFKSCAKLQRQLIEERREAADAIEARDAEIAAFKADMPTIWEDPAGKGYPCFERPMTPLETRETIARFGAEVARLRETLERIAKGSAVVLNQGITFDGAPMRGQEAQRIARAALKGEAS